MSSLKSLRCYYTLTVTLVLLIVLLALLGGPSSLFVHVHQDDEQMCPPGMSCPGWTADDFAHLLQDHVAAEINLQRIKIQQPEQIHTRKGTSRSSSPFEKDDSPTGVSDMATSLSKSQHDQLEVNDERDRNSFTAIKRLYLPRIQKSSFTSRNLQSDGTGSFRGVQNPRPISTAKIAPVLVEKNSRPDTDLNSLVRMLKGKLKAAQIKELQFGATCDSNKSIANSCDGDQADCLRTELPKDLEMRVSQLVTPHRLQINTNIQNVLREMAQKVVGHYDVILATAASFNHYLESQAMVKNVHEKFFPVLKNFTFIYYNLGLTPKQRQSLVENCRCQVLDFPFERFPAFMSNLSCYSWKPVIIKAHLHQANVLIWADASIRFHANPSDLHIVIDQARRRGIQLGITPAMSPFRTFRNMYHFFGDEPCAYMKMKQAMATMGFYGRDSFVDRAILEPWVGCAVREKCMCDLEGKRFSQAKDCRKTGKLDIDWQTGNSTISYGLCHRFDQSAISLILHKLYQGYYRWVMIRAITYVDVQRGNKLFTYFSTN